MAKKLYAEIPGHRMIVRKRATKSRIVKDPTVKWAVTCSCGYMATSLYATRIGASSVADAHLFVVNPLLKVEE